MIDALFLGVAVTGLGKVIGFGFGWLSTGAAFVIGYFVLMDVCCGATLGKFALGLRVLGSNSERPTLREAFMRESFTLLGAIPFAGPFLAIGAWVWIVLTIRSNSLRQGKHDMLAGGTHVVRIAVR
jgi:uncharacterized RDD family membrane protein YckC